MTTKTTVDGIAMIGKLLDMWPRDDDPLYTEVSPADADDILRTIDYELSTFNDCSAILRRHLGKPLMSVSNSPLGYVKTTHGAVRVAGTSRVKLRTDFLKSIKYGQYADKQQEQQAPAGEATGEASTGSGTEGSIPKS